MKYSFLIFILITASVQAQIDPPAPSLNDTIPNDVFPLIGGHRFVYTGYFTNADTETPIAGTNTFYEFVTLKVFDVLGKEIATLANENQTAGKYVAKFNASKLPSGLYFYQIKAGKFVETKKMMLMR